MASHNNVVYAGNKLTAFVEAVVNLENNKVPIAESKSAGLTVSSSSPWMKNARINGDLAQGSGVENILLRRVYYSHKDADNEERPNSLVCTANTERNLFKKSKVNGSENPWSLASVNTWPGKKCKDLEHYFSALDWHCQTAPYKIDNSSCADDDDEAKEDGVPPLRHPCKQSSKQPLCSIRHRSNGNGKVIDNFCHFNSKIMQPVESRVISHLCNSSAEDSILVSREDVLRGSSCLTHDEPLTTRAREGNSIPAANSSAANQKAAPGVSCLQSSTYCLKMLEKDSSKFGVFSNVCTKKNDRTRMDNKLSIKIDSQPTSITSVNPSSYEIEEIVEEKKLGRVVGKTSQIESPRAVDMSAIKRNHERQQRCGPWLVQKAIHSTEHQPNTGYKNPFSKSHLTALTSSLKRRNGQWQSINAHASLDKLQCKGAVRGDAPPPSMCFFSSQSHRVCIPSEDSAFRKTKRNPSLPRDPQIVYNEIHSENVLTKEVSESTGNGYFTTARDQQSHTQTNEIKLKSPSLMSFDEDLIKPTFGNNASAATLDDNYARMENPCQLKLKEQTQINKETVHRGDKSPQSEHRFSAPETLHPDSIDNENAEFQIAYGRKSKAVSRISSLESKKLSNKVNSTPLLNTETVRHKTKSNLRFSRSDGPRPYRCQFDSCTRTYRKRSHLIFHQRIHTGEKPFLCRWKGCDMTFRRNDELKRHHRRHTGERPYKCWYCLRTFSRSDHRILHVRKIHPEEDRKRGAS